MAEEETEAPKEPGAVEPGEQEEVAGEDAGNLVTEANAAAENIKGATAELKAQLDRQEKLKATEILGGKTTAGVAQKEETAEEYAQRVQANDVSTTS